jgi:hypothetical protein
MVMSQMSLSSHFFSFAEMEELYRTDSINPGLLKKETRSLSPMERAEAMAIQYLILRGLKRRNKPWCLATLKSRGQI